MSASPLDSRYRAWFRAGAVHALVLTALLGTAAQAQYARYTYPRGYGDFGWYGWGGAGGGTAQGDIARGLGAFAQGVGEANLSNAQAASINTDTVMRWNNYMYQSQLEANRRYQENLARKQQNNTRTREEIYRRLRDNPTSADVARGDALNVAFDEINDPKTQSVTLKYANAVVPGTLIRDIPFQVASAAITASVNQVVGNGPPAALKTATFRPEADELKKIAAELRKQNEETGKHDPATLERAREQLKRLSEKVETTYKRNTPQRRDSERWIKAAYGLTRLLETPAVEVLLAGVEKRPDTTLRDLLGFMNAFNLRFGAATTDQQRQAYSTLYPLLVSLRDKSAKDREAMAGARPSATGEQPTEFFEGMDVKQLQTKAAAPKPPAPGSN